MALTHIQRTRKFEDAWSRYMDTLRKVDEEIGRGGKKARSVRTRAKLSVRTAYRNLRRVCMEIGETCPLDHRYTDDTGPG